MKKINVYIYGLFPTIYSMCAPCCTHDYLSACKSEYSDEQLLEYPKWVQDNQSKLIQVLTELGKFGRYLKIRVVNADTLRGIWLAIRYRLKLEPAVIVGKKVFKGENLDLNAIVNYIIKELKVGKLESPR